MEPICSLYFNTRCGLNCGENETTFNLKVSQVVIKLYHTDFHSGMLPDLIRD